jgi:hypothetical protein
LKARGVRDASAHFAGLLANAGIQRSSNETAARSPSCLPGCASWGRRNHSLIHRSVLPALLLACFSVAAGVAVRASAAETPREVHGMADAFAAAGVAVAWGVVRGASETATVVAIRVVSDTALYPWVAVAASDPFTHQQHALLRPMSSPGVIDVRSPRANFADFPRTELRFYDSAAEARSGVPKLIVFYLGVPDTTPEFATEDKLDAYLTDRIARLRGDGGSKTP